MKDWLKFYHSQRVRIFAEWKLPDLFCIPYTKDILYNKIEVLFFGQFIWRIRVNTLCCELGKRQWSRCPQAWHSMEPLDRLVLDAGHNLIQSNLDWMCANEGSREDGVAAARIVDLTSCSGHFMIVCHSTIPAPRCLGFSSGLRGHIYTEIRRVRGS